MISINLHNPTIRVINILNLLSNNSKGYNLIEISRLLNIPKSTISPILKTLLEKEFISLDADLKYKIGKSLFKIGTSYLDTSDNFSIIKSCMKNIVNECNEICQLGVFQNGDVLYIYKEEPLQAIKLVSSVGKTLPAYATAIGKSLLVNYEIEDLKKIYNNKLIPLTDKTVKDFNDLYKDILFIRENHYCIEFEEASKEIVCIGTPLLNKKCDVFAAISISFPKYRETKEKKDIILKALLKNKREIEAHLDEVDTSFQINNYFM